MPCKGQGILPTVPVVGLSGSGGGLAQSHAARKGQRRGLSLVLCSLNASCSGVSVCYTLLVTGIPCSVLKGKKFSLKWENSLDRQTPEGALIPTIESSLHWKSTVRGNSLELGSGI